MSDDSKTSFSRSDDSESSLSGEKYNNIYNAIVERIYDDRCCDLVKRAYSYWSSRLSVTINQTVKILTHLVKKHKISRREFDIRYAIFQISVQRLNQILVHALKKILRKDGKADCLAAQENFNYGHRCFSNDYCKNSSASAIVLALNALRNIVAITLNLHLDRSTQECSINTVLDRLCVSLKVSTSLEGCYEKDCYKGPRKSCHKRHKSSCSDEKKWKYEDY